MLASEGTAPFSDPEWTFEVKLDGIRVIAAKSAGGISLATRTGREIAAKFPGISEDLAKMPLAEFVFDGEVVLFERNGLTSFQDLMKRFQVERAEEIAGMDRANHVDYCIFDVLFLEGNDLRRCSLLERRRVLESLQLRTPNIRVLDSYAETGELLFDRATHAGFEGVMAKRLSSTYESGRRSESWLKLKAHHTEEFVVGGYTGGLGQRASTFGALMLGRRNSDGTLTHVGNVGGGFAEDQLAELKAELGPLTSERNPFDSTPIVKGKGKRTWLRPERLAEVRYASWTTDGHLRFPVFVRMRPDLSVTPETGFESLGRPALAVDGEGGRIVNVMEAERRSGDDSVAELVAALEDPADDLHVSVEGRTLHLSHLSKELWPATELSAAVTKRDLIRYYAQVSHLILPHLRNRPLSFVRHPDGIQKPGFFQKHPLPGMPEFVRRVRIWSESNERALDWIECDDLATLIWLGQVGTVEIHPWYSRSVADEGDDTLGTIFDTEAGLEDSTLNYPDFVVFDLDPNIEGSAKELGAKRAYDPAAWKRTASVALGLKELLDTVKLHSYVKSSGKTGLHVFVPIKRVYDYDTVRSIAETFGRELERSRPDDVTMVWSVRKRPAAVFFDHNQNVRGKTLASVFSPRAAAGAPVSFPLRWEEVGDTRPADFNIHTAPALLADRGPIWKGLLTERQTLSV